MENIVRLVVLSFAVMCLQLQCESASFGQKVQEKRRLVKRSMVPLSSLPDDAAYANLAPCDRVVCPPQNLDGCHLKEVIIWKTGHNKFCRSCEYCLDWPWRAARARRSAVQLLTSDNQLQPEVHEPEVNKAEVDIVMHSGKRQRREVNQELINLFNLNLEEGGDQDRAITEERPRHRRFAYPGKANVNADEVFNALCPHVTCPVEPPNETCEHTEEVQGYIRGRRCLSCATCIDKSSPSGGQGRYQAPHWFQ